MARYKIPYTGLNDSLKHLRIQIIDSLPYTVKNLPRFSTPEEVFKFCKSKFTYKNDPQGVELFQSVGTLLENNGQGDCDCATIFCICMLLNSGFTNCGIVLVGRNKLNPTHIYAYTIDKDEKQILDLTNKKFNTERPYPFKQTIPFKISKEQLNMFLQLADSGKRQRRKKINFAKPNESIFIPSKNVYIPFSKVDKLPIKKAKQMLLSEGYEVMQLSEYLSGRAERKAKKKQKAENKQVKFETKQAKKGAKTEVIKGKAEKKSASADKKRSSGRAKETRAEAKRIKEERREAGEESGGMKLFNKAGKLIKEIVLKPSDEEEEQTDETETPEAETENETNAPEEQEQETEEQELEEGVLDLNKTDLVNGVLFAVGFFLEKTKKVA